MNFEQWYKENYGNVDFGEKEPASEAWNACKNEVEKILNHAEFLCPARKDFINYLKSELEKL